MHPSTEISKENYVITVDFVGTLLIFTFSSHPEVSRETQNTAVCSRQTDFEEGIACFFPSLDTPMGEN